MAAPTNNPMAVPQSTSTPSLTHPAPVSEHTFHIAGIKTTVHGLSELPQRSSEVAVLWLLHPRLQTQECMAPVAAAMIADWNTRIREGRDGGYGGRKGLVGVSFDQRNHGGRLVDEVANEAWRSGNPRHAQDMFSIYHGTSRDTSLLMDYLSAYVFPTNTHTITQHLALGISLGGHAVWHCLLQDPRITAGVVVIGCPDYVRLMSDRARLSQLDTYIDSHPPGRNFLGSQDFPKGLIEAVEKYDPAGLLLGELDTVTGQDHLDEPSNSEKTRLRPIMRDALGGKKILCLSGGADKLVPYKCGEPFMDWLKNALKKDGGWFNDRGVVLEDIIDQEAGHVYSEKMRVEAGRFIGDALADEVQPRSDSRTSKI